ncbi:MFS general substrate transporter [Exidia glandulosa HHB12029]|uniref:MFS general substrate transporter n=1 Tax=Exidia glandulosa HHB12029 TaxID=1314781 RepID=A0A165QUU6_EXIGL|nr:MFS general substrate transporter [Exidia glandulosa HHB12029]
MTFPAAGTDSTDPASQVAWPRQAGTHTPERSQPVGGASAAGDGSRDGSRLQRSVSSARSIRQMSVWHLFTLSVSMGGAQMAWIIELAYGTPFLVDLGISEQMTSLVWLAGPISGLVAQPLIGAVSDASYSKYRRRKWVVASTGVLVASIILLSFTREIASVIVDLMNIGEGDWDPKRLSAIKSIAIAIAIFAFYFLDFALNGLQASLRNLLLDVTPAEQLNQANAWHGRMNHAGSIIGNGIGFINLAAFPLFNFLGGDQFRKFSFVVLIVLVSTVWITCFSHEEAPRTDNFRRQGRTSLISIFADIIKSIKNLPKPIRRVCFVQLFAWMGWFPFLFYSTLWVGEVMANELGEDPDKDVATRAGEFALCLHAITAALFGWLLPLLTKRDRRLLVFEDDPRDHDLAQIRNMVRGWRAEAMREGKKLKLPTMPFMLRNIWTAALLLFAVLMGLSVFVRTVVQATIIIAALGICWSVAMWIPFAIIMEYLKGRDLPGVETRSETAPPPYSRRLSLPTPSWRARERVAAAERAANERTPLVRSRSYVADETDEMEEEKKELGGGTILGIHNLAVVIPQFAVAIISSIIFRLVDENEGSNGHLYLGKHGVTWVLGFGGFCAVIAAVISRRVPPTRPEKEIRQKLAEIIEAEGLGLA